VTTFRGLRRLATVVAIDLAVGLAAVAPLADATSHRVAAPATSVVSAPANAGTKFGDAVDLGSMRGKPLAQPVVGIAPTRSGKGYWLVARDGGIFSFGDAAFFGSTGAIRLNQPIVGITASPTGKGYWFVAADGGIFSFGDARFAGSTGAMRLAQPIVGMAATPTGKGYWLVASDGGIFNFGDATFRGSAAGKSSQPIVGMTPTATGKGYWLVSRDGSVFGFGDATSYGSAAGRSGQPVVGMARSALGTGYWLGTTDAAVFPFGTAGNFGSGSTMSPVVGIAATPTGAGYWLVTADGNVLSSVSTPAASGSFAFLRIGRQSTPVRYNPCVDQHYVINPAFAPAGAVDEVKTAFARLGAATGIRFVYDGTTLESHSRFGGRQSFQPLVYGQRWAPILITWTTSIVEPLLAGGTLGYGGSTSFWQGTSDEAYVTGEVVFDTDQQVLAAGFGPGLTRGNLIQHELGHVVGLDHVDDRSQLMYPSIHSASPDGYGAGDRAGLAQLGSRQGCLTVAKPAA
jgi:hypothetical protein